MKKYKVLLLITLILGIFSNVYADSGVWKFHSVFNESRMRIVDTGSKVYSLTDNFLNAYDKASGKFVDVNILNSLSDYYVKNIYYNHKKGYLVVTYIDYNIDILLPSGATVSIPDLKEMTITSPRDINDVTFCDNGFYVSTKIGYLFIDDNKFTISHSALFDSEINSMGEVGNHILVSSAGNIYYTRKGEPINNLSSLSSTSLGISGSIIPISHNRFFINGNLLYLVTVDSNNSFTKTALSSAKVVDVQRVKDGFIALGGSSLTSTNRFYSFSADGVKTADIALPASLTGHLLSSQEVDGSLWTLAADGLRKISLDTSSSQVDYKSDLLRPVAINTKRPISLSYNPANGRIYMSNGSPRSNFTVQKYGLAAKIMSYDGIKWHDEVPASLQGYRFQDPARLLFPSSSSHTYYVGTWYEGVYKVTDGNIVGKYDWTNSPLIHALNNWYCYVPCLQFDSHGNLWLMQCNGEVNILPYQHIDSPSQSLSATHWKCIDDFSLEAKSAEFFITHHDYKIIYDGYLDGSISIFTTDDNMNITAKKVFKHFYDKQGKKVSWSYIFDIKEDLDGTVWVASSSGIFSFRAEEFLNDDFRVNIPVDSSRNNQYILDSTIAMSISIDEYNRKWVGSFVSGLFLLNEDCSKILKHFHSGNACFPNDNVIDVCWNPSTQSVFVGLNGALLEYIPENTSHTSHMYVHPMRITPSMPSHITFHNIPLYSTLFITDKGGNPVTTIQADKSVIYWDGLTDKGQPLPTGIYFVGVKLPGRDKISEKAMTFTVIAH